MEATSGAFDLVKLSVGRTQMLGEYMANDTVKRGHQSVEENTSKRTTSISAHVGQNAVQIDAIALRHLIETLRAKLTPEPKSPS
jgi:hypothetical protein